MASILKVDDLRGNTAAGNVTITAENNSNTFSLQKSVAKVTGNLQSDASSNAAVSLNISSVADGGTGLNTVTVTNAFSAALAVAALISNHDSSYNRAGTVDNTSASAFITRMYTASGGALSDSDAAHSIAFFGDLA
jgi:hypothetical protein